MKLLNPTQRVIFLRDEVNRKLIVLKPEEMIDVSHTQRETFSKYVQGFQLRWILDDTDLPPHLRGTGEERQGTLQYYQKYEQKGADDGTFDASKALAQSDSREVAEIWKEHDTVRYIPHVSTNKPIKPGSEEDFLFLKEDSTEQTQEGKVIQEISPLTREELDTILSGGHGSDEDTTLFEEPLVKDISPRQKTPEDTGLLLGVRAGGEEETQLPDDAPVTLSQLTFSTKAQIFEMCDKLGLDASGTKKELINRVVKYYQNVHYTNMQTKGTP